MKGFPLTPGQAEWIGIFVILGACLQFLTGFLKVAEKAWKLVNKVINDCQRRRELQAKRKARRIARALAKRVPMPKAAIGAERFPAGKSASKANKRQGPKNDCPNGKAAPPSAPDDVVKQNEAK